jgi:hypothetical protein
MNEPTLKQWRRRALKAEAELETLRRIRTFEYQEALAGYKLGAAMKVTLDEIQDALDWAKERANESN